ncbi:MAG TPA: hypothetical protein VKR54_03410 [Candidatus Babeliales bacterium]|jgi:hypothetical protein|nr:hypothetical protein [Candidatus Babeliales bacterium]
MKKFNSIAPLLAIASLTASINAYENSFFNNTDTPIGIAIQYNSDDGGTEPLYRLLIKPHSMGILTPGKIIGGVFTADKVEIPAIKWAFCLDKIYYIDNPTHEQKIHNFEKTFWREVPITWTTEKSVTKRHEPQATKKQQRGLKRTKKPAPVVEDKSLCRDRHFDIIRNEHGKLVITASLVE